MNFFEFLAIIFSIIIGLSFSKLVEAMVGSIRIALKGEVHLLPMIWLVNVILWISTIWWGMFEWSNKPDWSLGNFIFLILYVLLIYFVSDYLVPDSAVKKYSTTDEFMKNKLAFFGAMILAFLMDAFETVLLSRQTHGRPIPEFFYSLIALAIVVLASSMFISNKKFQIGTALFFLVNMIGYILIH